MKISIAMATFNGANYLREQLDSFLKQDLLPNELIVCDDKSTDSTLAILEEFARTSPFLVKIYKNKTRLGYSQNFAKALSLCDGDFVFLSDQDDVWCKNKISLSIYLMRKKQKANLLFTNALLVDSNLNPLNITLQEFNKRDTNDKDPNNHGCCICVRKSFLDEFLPVPNDWGHDNWLNACAKLTNSKIIINDILMLYRRHESAVTAYRLGNIYYCYFKKFIDLKNKKNKLKNDYNCFEQLFFRFSFKRFKYPEAYKKLLEKKKCYKGRLQCYNNFGFERFKYILMLIKKGYYKTFSDSWKRIIEDMLI